MLFRRIAPSALIQSVIECYWFIEDNDATPVCQKIIPDGFPEILFHYGDPYRIKLNKEWELQEEFLLAGQLTKFFFLENTGKTGVIGIKLKPTGLFRLFGLSMKDYTDKVVAIKEMSEGILPIREIVSKTNDPEQVVNDLNTYFGKLIAEKNISRGSLDNAIDLVFQRKGMITVKELATDAFLSDRQFLNQFNQQVGISPKLFTRIVRLNYIFQLVKENKNKWSSLAYQAAYFDQAHFIKDFKNLTGENPNKYDFDEKNFANFFLMPDAKHLFNH